VKFLQVFYKIFCSPEGGTHSHTHGRTAREHNVSTKYSGPPEA